jgi:acyl-CoA thioesterase-2
MNPALDHLVSLLTLEPAGADRWRGGGSRNDGVDGTYGGHMLGQAAAAAIASCDDGRVLHSMHAYFLRGGQPGEPYEYAVERVRDGRSFSMRRVSAWQHGRHVLELTASLTEPATGHNIDAVPPADFASLPAPEALPSYSDIMAALDPTPLPEDWARRPLAIELRPVNAPWIARGPSAAGGIRHWIRAVDRLPVEQGLHTAMLAYQSDESLADCLLVPLGMTWGTPGTTFVSLDHAMWFHRPFSLNDWLFVEQWPGKAEHGRGLAHGRVWSRAGELVCTYAQEALMRMDA